MPEFNWDVSKDRAEFVAEIANSVRRQQYVTRVALKNSSLNFQEELNKYETVLRNQLFELRGHVIDTDEVEDEDIEKLETIMDNLEKNSLDKKTMLKKFEKIDKELTDIRIDVGLDIGKTEKDDGGPEDLFE